MTVIDHSGAKAALSPAGVRRMQVRRTRPDGRAPGEVHYYMYPEGLLARHSVYRGTTGAVPWPYGGFHLEATDAHGGWIASAVDILRFVTAVDAGPWRVAKDGSE